MGVEVAALLREHQAMYKMSGGKAKELVSKHEAEVAALHAHHRRTSRVTSDVQAQQLALQHEAEVAA